MSTWLHCGDVNGARVEFTVHMEGGEQWKWADDIAKWASDFWHFISLHADYEGP